MNELDQCDPSKNKEMIDHSISDSKDDLPINSLKTKYTKDESISGTESHADSKPDSIVSDSIASESHDDAVSDAKEEDEYKPPGSP